MGKIEKEQYYYWNVVLRAGHPIGYSFEVIVERRAPYLMLTVKEVIVANWLLEETINKKSHQQWGYYSWELNKMRDQIGKMLDEGLQL